MTRSGKKGENMTVIKMLSEGLDVALYEFREHSDNCFEGYRQTKNSVESRTVLEKYCLKKLEDCSDWK